MEKEFIKLEISKDKNQNPIQLDIQFDDADIDPGNCGGEEEVVRPVVKRKVDKTSCCKCKQNKSNYHVRNEFVCRNCFLRNVNHKFRSNLRAHCKIRHEDFVLVCVSGGINSMAMLHWFNTTFNDSQSKRKLFFKLKVLYVDDSIFLKDLAAIKQERAQRRKFMQELCSSYKFDLEIICLEHAFFLPKFDKVDLNELSNSLKLTETNDEAIKNYLSLYDELTDLGNFDEDFNKIMVRNLTFYYAVSNHFTKVVFGNSAQSLVNEIFKTVAKGRGFTLRENVGYIDNHYLNGKITILRPMKDFLLREILLYNYMFRLDLIYSQRGEKPTGKKHTIPFRGNTDQLVGSFLNNLQEKLTSTVTTVLNTAEKLKPKAKFAFDSKEPPLCELCLNYLDDLYNQLEVGSIDTMSNDKIFFSKNFCFGCKRMLQPLQDRPDVIKRIPLFYSNDLNNKSI